MKILHLNTNDIFGGAARAAFRLNYGLRKINIDSKMLVQDKKSDDRHVIGPESKVSKAWSLIRPHFDSLALQLYRRRKKTIYHIQWLPGSPLNKISIVNPDIINLHWICDGFFRIETLKKIKKPIVWTLHDMWAFTGGCHYSEDCKRYKSSCGKCPQLRSHKEKDFSRWVWHRKKKAWQNLNLTIVTPSRWLAECAKESSLFQNTKIKVIPNGLDLKRYKPIDRSVARKLLGLPKNRKLVLFGAIEATSDPRKGFEYLIPAIQKLKVNSWAKEIDIIVFGASESENSINFGVPTHFMGRLYDDISLTILYSAADVMLVPSIQEAFGQTASEAMACATPVVAFDTSGLKDIVDHKVNGYLARPFDTFDFAKGIEFLLFQRTKTEDIRRSARKKVEEKFEIEKVAKMYMNLYKNVLSKTIK